MLSIAVLTHGYLYVKSKRKKNIEIKKIKKLSKTRPLNVGD